THQNDKPFRPVNKEQTQAAVSLLEKARVHYCWVRSGEVTPSKADRLITERLVQALGLVDIRVPDHLIVGGNQVFSFAEHGLL
ncbi:JAB domain-containing protein, partial [Escherichia coli]|uniref:JAB domain-containing protein n=2 Tax=Escherichia coli TaxID=562 RepID=UPI003B9D58F5